MIEALHVLLLIGGSLALIGVVVLVVFRILNLGSPHESIAPSPDAWRVKHGNRYYYMDKTEPFPTQDAEPLYLGKQR
jgi:hypothetical protein